LLQRRVTEEIGDLPTLLNADPIRARARILQHVSEIRMTPVATGEKSFYVADCEWHLLGNDAENMKVTGSVLNGDFRSVAGEGFEPSTFGL
jgi:hypothetical protein